MLCALTFSPKQAARSMTAACFHAAVGYVRHMPYSLPQSESHLDKPEDGNSLDPAWQNLKRRLSSGNPDTWNEVFDLLYPVAFQSARVILSGKFESDCEDVAMETMKEILDQAMHAASLEALVPLTASIARNKSKDLLRRRLAEKRGGNNLESLDLLIESSGERAVALPQADFLDALTVSEVRDLLAELSKEVKKEYRLVLKDHFFDHLSHSEIADKRKIAIHPGSWCGMAEVMAQGLDEPEFAVSRVWCARGLRVSQHEVC